MKFALMTMALLTAAACARQPEPAPMVVTPPAAPAYDASMK
ncbi:hypothetical protein SAMN04488003_10572 [Loktanella fryxellensis]|uniref:Lipoprotein n=1 Tax=Loktanella fryxellensis TaxID=245187 RepID=A0A1H8BJT5_9RHOB|nr:hypothetical protein [Loktanella fryxellensis]SEM83052.1 hypothetical protein SAMN04488003_10572 [Loktanella fryxellensis]